MTMFSWSKTAASNSTADSSVNWAEGQAPSSVNDSARAMMAAVAKWRDDNSGSLTTGGTSTAYTLTTNQSFSSLSVMNGQSLSFKMSATNGASPTLAVDGLTAKAIHSVQGTAIGTGVLLANSVVTVVYDNSNNCFVVVGAAFPSFPSATSMLFRQTAAPTGWTKVTSYNDAAIRVVNGTINDVSGSATFSSVFTSRTISQANLPNVSFTNSGITLSDTRTWATASVISGVAGLVSASGVGGILGASSGAVGVSSTGGSLSVSAQGSAASGGSGTALDFNVFYLDVIIATKD